MTTLGVILLSVLVAITIGSVIVVAMEQADREMWSDRAIKHLQEVEIKDLHISRLEEKIKALEGEKKIDERRDRENPCCGKCVLPVLLPRHECRREKSHH